MKEYQKLKEKALKYNPHNFQRRGKMKAGKNHSTTDKGKNSRKVKYKRKSIVTWYQNRH